MILTAVVTVLLPFVKFVMGGVGAGWEYTGPLGPDQWHTQYPVCGGRMQSPINIDTTDVLYDRQLQPFDLSMYDSCDGCNLLLENVGGHTAEVKYSGQPITLRGGSLPDDYILDQFHFHWGGSNDKGSEHLLDSQPAPMEMHIVHHMRKFNKSESSAQPYGLAVLGFFFQLGDTNPNFDKLLSHFGNITHRDQHVELEPFSLSGLLPTNAQSYFRYYGSLTTPPCYETVIWTIFSDKIVISEEQLEVFRSLKTVRAGESEEVAIVNDFRPVQALHERRVTSNSRDILHDMTSELVARFMKEIDDLKENCSENGGATLTVSTVLGCCWLLSVFFLSRAARGFGL